MNWKKIVFGTFTLKRLIRSTFILYAMATVLAYFYSSKLIFPYNQTSYDINLKGLTMISGKDKTPIATRFWQADDEKYLILYFHGNYLDLGDLDSIASKLTAHHYSVLAIDYRGYGLSQGVPTEKNSYADAESLYEYALKKGYNKENIIFMGRSIGTGIATQLASKHPNKALILISPYVSIYRVMTKYPIIIFDKFKTLAKINSINSKLFLVHGSDDRIIPAWHSKKIFDRFNSIKQREVFTGFGHNDIWDVPEQAFLDKLDIFIKKNH